MPVSFVIAGNAGSSFGISLPLRSNLGIGIKRLGQARVVGSHLCRFDFTNWQRYGRHFANGILMSLYDASAVTAGLSEPQIKLTANGKVYVGRHISMQQWIDKYLPRFSDIQNAETDPIKARQFADDFITDMFTPHRQLSKPSTWVQHNPVPDILEHEQFYKMFTDFFVLQVSWVQRLTATLTPQTPPRDELRRRSVKSRQNEDKGEPMPLGLQLALFNHFYPGLWSSPSYTTTDKVISRRALYYYFEALWRVMSLNQIQTGLGVAYGTAMANSSDDTKSKIQRHGDDLWSHALAKQR